MTFGRHRHSLYNGKNQQETVCLYIQTKINEYPKAYLALSKSGRKYFKCLDCWSYVVYFLRSFLHFGTLLTVKYLMTKPSSIIRWQLRMNTRINLLDQSKHILFEASAHVYWRNKRCLQLWMYKSKTCSKLRQFLSDCSQSYKCCNCLFSHQSSLSVVNLIVNKRFVFVQIKLHKFSRT